MIRKAVLLSVVIVLAVVISGCNTVYRASKGAAEGAKQDLEEAKKADAWMQKNLW